MKQELVRMNSIDGIEMVGILYEPEEKSNTIVIHVHGLCGNFYENRFLDTLAKTYTKKETSFLTFNNRGTNFISELLKGNEFEIIGGCYEKFTDCLLDIDGAVNYVKEKGYTDIILEGHSYGCNKLIYYYYKKHPNIIGLIFASAPDMMGLHLYRQTDYKELIKEAKENIDNGKPTKILSNIVEDYMYMSSQTYYDWFNEKSNLDNLPVMSYSENWYQFETIDVPILTFSGSNETDNYLHLDLLKNKAKGCNNFEYKIIIIKGIAVIKSKHTSSHFIYIVCFKFI